MERSGMRTSSSTRLHGPPGPGKRVLTGMEAADTVFFLSDGSPDVGTIHEFCQILARVAHPDRHRCVRIHSIALLKGRTLQGEGADGR